MGSEGGAIEEAKLQCLGKQNSLYSLTLDEVQNQLGDLEKPLGNMNLDELLRSLWTTQDNAGASTLASSLHPQGSLTLSRDLSKQTVDDIWRYIQQKKNNVNNNSSNSNNQERKAQQEHPALGEMTLEGFLVEAGMNAALPLGNDSAAPDPMAATQQHNQWMQFQLPSEQQPPHQHNMMAVFMPGQPIQQSLPVLDAAPMSPSSLVGTLSDTQMPGRKRVASGDVAEKTVERKQKRMIKNRESAARSRARKQAYTHELEIKVTRLEEENQRLRSQKELEQVLPCVLPAEPKCQLRRTSSAHF